MEADEQPNLLFITDCSVSVDKYVAAKESPVYSDLFTASSSLGLKLSPVTLCENYRSLLG